MKARVLCCAIVSLVIAFAIPAFAAGATSVAPAAPAKPAEAKPLPQDPLGRGTPHGTVFGFLRAADKNDYELAARYLEGRQPTREKQQLAHDLKIVLNRGLKIGLEDVSKAPEGRLDDDLNVYLEKIGTAEYANEKLDIVLRRTTSPDAPPVWLFSAETLRGVTAAADQFEVVWTEAMWSERFRTIQILSYPLFRLLNQLASILILLAASWLLTWTLIAVMRPMLVRRHKQDAAKALAEVKWLLFLLIFGLLLRIAAMHSVTIAGRIFFATVATVIIIVAVSWLLARLTRLAARARILRLQKLGMPSGIAAVELTGWVLVCIYVIVGLFLILRSLGFEVTAAVAGLGVGGIVIAFAAQKTIENLFGTFTIVTDKPIHVGDQCQVGSTEGSVESIGLRSTQIRTADRAVVTIPNGQLATMAVSNLSERDKLLFKHNIRLRYDTTADQMRLVLANIRTTMAAHAHLETASVRTRLVKFGETAIEIEALAYVLTRDGVAFLEIQENLLLRIMDIVEASGTALAAPAQNTPPVRGFAVRPRPRETTSHG